MSNIDPVTYTRKVADLYLKEVFDELFQEYPAIYRSETLQTSFEITGKDGDLYLQRTGDLDSADVPDELRLMSWQRDDRFQAGPWDLVFERNNSGRINRFVLEGPRTGKITFYRE